MSQDGENKVIRSAPVMIMIKTIGSLFTCVVGILYFLGSSDKDGFISSLQLIETRDIYFILAGLIIIILLIVLFWYLDWRTRSLTIKDSELYYCSGIVNKRKLTISYQNVSTVDLTRPLFYRFLHLTKLKVDSNSVGKTAGVKTDINLGLNKVMADQVRTLILNKVHGDQKENVDNYAGDILYKASVGKLLCNALFSMLTISIIFISIIAVPVIFLFDSAIVILIIYMLGVIGVVGILIVSTVVSLGGMVLSKEFDRIRISYGTLEKKNISMPINKINGVIVTQNILQKLFKLCDLRVLSAGYGDESNEVMSYLAVSTKYEEAMKIKDAIIGKEDSEYTSVKPSTKMSILFHLPTLLMGLIIIFLALFDFISFFEGKIYLIVSIALFVLFLMAGILNYFNSQMSFQKKYFRINKGGIYGQTAYIKRRSCQIITYRQGILQRIFGGGKLTIFLYATAGKNIIKIYNIDKKVLSGFNF